MKVGSETVDLPMDLHGKSCMNSTLYDVVHHLHKAQAACGLLLNKLESLDLCPQWPGNQASLFLFLYMHQAIEFNNLL